MQPRPGLGATRLVQDLGLYPMEKPVPSLFSRKRYHGKQHKLNMNRILFLAGMVTLLGSAGCIVPEGGHRGVRET